MDELISLLDQDDLEINQIEENQNSQLAETKPSEEPGLRDVDLNLFGNGSENNSSVLPNDAKCLQESLIHTGDDSSDEENQSNPGVSRYNEYGRAIKSALSSQMKYSYQPSLATNKNISSWKKSTKVKEEDKKAGGIKCLSSHNSLKEKNLNVDYFSGIAIKNPVVSSVEMKERMLGRRLIQMNCISMNLRGGDIEGDWVTVGVIVKKCDQKKSSKGSMYSIWNMSDLKDCNKVISLFLFGKTHEQHWKTSVGSVIGLLNPSVMPQKDTYKGNDLSISVDNPQKLLFMGTSRDFGICKGRRKDGATCTMVVNRSQCEYCQYHVSKEYYKTSNKRMELQAAYSSAEPKGLKQRILGKQGIFYGGQYFSPVRAAEKPTKKQQNSKSPGLIKCVNQQLQQKANAMATDAKKEAAMLLTETVADEQDAMEKHSNRISSGSRNLFQHLQKETETTQDCTGKQLQVKSVTPKQLLTMHADELAKNFQKRKGELNNSAIDSVPLPVLGKGMAPGGCITLGSISSITSKAKLKAIQTIKSRGHIGKKDPNFAPAQRHSIEFQEKIKKRLASEIENPKNEETSKKLKMDSEAFEKLLNRKSNHDYLVQEHEIEKQNDYFGFMGKKEQLETKMSSIMETPCKVVSCQNCHYTALSALDSCRKENHKLVVSKAMKRFFMCKNCKKRTISFSKLPTKPCSCGERNYERVAMFKECKGPVLDSEQLLIRGHEINSLNSTAYVKCANLNL